MVLTDLQTVGGVAVLVAILVQVVKSWLPAEAVNVVALLAGILIAVGAALLLPHVSADLGNAVLTGFLGGAASIGLYTAQKGLPTPVLAPKADQPPPHG